MSTSLRPDFVNLKSCTRALNGVLGTLPHALHDNFGNCLSSLMPESATATIEVVVQGKTLAKLSAQDSQITLLKGMVETALDAELRAQEALVQLEIAEPATGDEA